MPTWTLYLLPTLLSSVIAGLVAGLGASWRVSTRVSLLEQRVSMQSDDHDKTILRLDAAIRESAAATINAQDSARKRDGEMTGQIAAINQQLATISEQLRQLWRVTMQAAHKGDE